MLHKEIPFLRIGLPLCAGIVSGLYFSPGKGFYIVSLAILVICFCSSLFFNRYLTNIIYGISLNLTLYLAGLLLYAEEKNRISILGPEEAIFTGQLDDFPEERENTFKLIFKLERIAGNYNQKPAGGSLVLYHRKDTEIPSILPGDRLVIRCTPIRITSRGNPYEFDYRFYMETRGIKYYAFTDSSDIISRSVPEKRKLTHSALIIREKIIDMFRERGIRGERLALVAALTLGQKNMLDPEQKQHFIKAGVMHIMAVSGLHAVILSLFIFKLLFFLKGRLNIVRIVVTIVILWAFAFITGLTPSVLRATLMFSFLQAGNLMKRPVNGINSVLASAFILILIRPSVIFDAGFLLSYSAVIFIICFYRDLYLKIIFKYRIPDLIWQSAAVTIIAQAGTLPLTLMYFNRFPTWFILSNIIIVPLSSLAVITGVLVPLTFPFHFLSQTIARILDFLTGLTEALTERASSLPFSTIDNIGISVSECIFLSITIFLFTRFILSRKSISVLYPLTALLLFVVAGTAREIPTRNSGELIVYNTMDYTTIGIRTGRILNTFSDTTSSIPDVDRHCAMLNLKERRNIITGSFCRIKAGNEKILITSSLKGSLLNTESPDIVILTGIKPVIDKNIRRNEPLDALVVSPQVPMRFRFPLENASLASDTMHFVRTEGAFHIKLELISK